MVHHLFEADSPPHRPIPCSDSAAHHYRWWLSALTVFTLVVLPWSLLLRVTALAPTLQAVCVEVYKAGFLLLLLLFLIRKRRVLGSGSVRKLWSGFTLAWIAYPLLVVTVAGLLVLQVIGFGVLVTWVGAGLLATVGVMLVVSAVSEYLADVIDRQARRAAEAGASRSAAGPEVGVDGARHHYVYGLARWTIRLMALLAGVLLIMQIWDVAVPQRWMNWRTIGLGVLVVVVALVLDRIMFTALLTLQRTDRLPRSTANLLRRWSRGLLSVVVVLALVAVAGFKIDSIWTLVTTLLAMVAIGFVAVWSMLSNILATLVILVWRPFNVGEWVEILPEALAGRVIDINFMYTILETEEGGRVAVPNNTFAQKFICRRRVKGEPQRSLAEQLEAEKPLGE